MLQHDNGGSKGICGQQISFTCFNGDAMMLSVNRKSVIRVPRICRFFSVIVGSVALCTSTVFSDDRQILEQLYQEIIGSSNGTGTVDNPVKLANGVAKSADNENIQPGSVHPDFDPAAEKLRQDIQKIVDEVNIRHEDAVKFMLDTK